MSKVQGFVIVACLIVVFFVVTYRDATKKREWVSSKPPITIFEIHEPPPLVVDLSPEYSAYLHHENHVLAQLTVHAKERAEKAEKERLKEENEKAKAIEKEKKIDENDFKDEISAIWEVRSISDSVTPPTGYTEGGGIQNFYVKTVK